MTGCQGTHLRLSVYYMYLLHVLQGTQEFWKKMANLPIGSAVNDSGKLNVSFPLVVIFGIFHEVYVRKHSSYFTCLFSI